MPEVGLEPTHLAVLDFESSASTNSTTRAARIAYQSRALATSRPPVGQDATRECEQPHDDRWKPPPSLMLAPVWPRTAAPLVPALQRCELGRLNGGNPCVAPSPCSPPQPSP